jgi:WD40 repeat protein
VTVWDAATGQPTNAMESFGSVPSPWTRVAFSADGKRIVLAQRGSGTVKVLDAESLQELHTIEGYKTFAGKIFAEVAISGDGQWAVRTSRHEGSLTVLDVLTKEKKLTVNNTGDVSCVEFSPDGCHLLTGTRDGMVKL